MAMAVAIMKSWLCQMVEGVFVCAFECL